MTLKVQGCEDIRFNASDCAKTVVSENQKEINDIVDAAHQALATCSQTDRMTSNYFSFIGGTFAPYEALCMIEF